MKMRKNTRHRHSKHDKNFYTCYKCGFIFDKECTNWTSLVSVVVTTEVDLEVKGGCPMCGAEIRI